MGERIIYEREDGGISVVVPATNCGLTVAQIAAKDVPSGIDFDIVDSSSIPKDRTFRNAWIKSGSTIKTDIPKAKEVAHKQRRAMRAKEFGPLDVKATIPLEAEQAEADRQAVREKFAVMQTSIDDAKTESALRSILVEHTKE